MRTIFRRQPQAAEAPAVLIPIPERCWSRASGPYPANMGVKAYNLGFAPRLGLAYQVKEHTVVRAGYGRSFTPAGLGAVFGQAPDYDPPVIIRNSTGSDNNYATGLQSADWTAGTSKSGWYRQRALSAPQWLERLLLLQSAKRLPDSALRFVESHGAASVYARLHSGGWLCRECGPTSVHESERKPGGPARSKQRSRHLATTSTPAGSTSRNSDWNSGIDETCNCDNSSYHAMQAKVAEACRPMVWICWLVHLR